MGAKPCGRVLWTSPRARAEIAVFSALRRVGALSRRLVFSARAKT